MKEKEFRNKITWFSFIFSLLVIWVHSYNSELYLGRTAAAATVYRLEHLLGDTIAQIAVPGFFMISSYLFFRNFNWSRLQSKWTSRIKTVLVPYILWNSLYYVGYVIASRIPYMTEVVGKGTIPFSLPVAVDAILNYTYNYVFWYLYQLILLIILAPVIYWLFKNIYRGIICLLVLMAAIYCRLQLPQLNLDALLYYSAAAFLAIHLKATTEQSWNPKRGITGACLLLAAIIIWQVRAMGTAGFTVLTTVLFRMVVPVALWLMVSESYLGENKTWMKNNFFLYAIHFAFVRLINKTGVLLLPVTPALPLIIYSLMPAIILTISYGLSTVMKRFMPRLFSLLTGGR